jgi:hypothetical protein
VNGRKQLASGRTYGGKYSGDEGRTHSQGANEPEQGGIDIGCEDDRLAALGDELRKRLGGRTCREQADRGGHRGHDERFDEQLAEDAQAAGANGQPYSKLLAALAGSCELKVEQIHAAE